MLSVVRLCSEVGAAGGLTPFGHLGWGYQSRDEFWARAGVDATCVAETPQQREAFACFEHLIDRMMSVLPACALWAYRHMEAIR